MENILEIQETCKEVAGILTELDWQGFMTIMCMLFDEYHNAHDDFDPVENSRVVADLVKEVNLTLGAYSNKAGE